MTKDYFPDDESDRSSSMGAIGKMLKRTRTKMVESEAERTANEFAERFRMRDGMYIRYTRNTSHGGMDTTGRIMSIESVFYNQRGGYTAIITVAPLLQTGQLGSTRRLMIATQGKRVVQITQGDYQIERVIV